MYVPPGRPNWQVTSPWQRNPDHCQMAKVSDGKSADGKSVIILVQPSGAVWVLCSRFWIKMVQCGAAQKIAAPLHQIEKLTKLPFA